MAQTRREYGRVHPREAWEHTTLRQCRTCGEEKPYIKFHITKIRADGKYIYMLDCGSCRNAERRIQRPPKKSKPQMGKDFLPIEPFRTWLKDTIVIYGWKEIENVTGVYERRLRRVVFENDERVSLDLVDTVLTKWGVHLSELYPYDED